MILVSQNRQMFSEAGQQIMFMGGVRIFGESLGSTARVVGFPSVVVDLALRAQNVGRVPLGGCVDVAAVRADAEWATMAADSLDEEGTVSLADEFALERNRLEDAIRQDAIADAATGNEIVEFIGTAVTVGHDVIDGFSVEATVGTGEVVSFEDLTARGGRDCFTSGKLGATAIVVHAWRGSISLSATGADRNSAPVFHTQLYPEFATQDAETLSPRTAQMVKRERHVSVEAQHG